MHRHHKSAPSAVRRATATDLDRGYLDTAAAATFLDLSPSFLRRLRDRGEGPSFYRVGRRVLYARDDLTAWVSRHRVELA
jgi:hypothetical protein